MIGKKCIECDQEALQNRRYCAKHFKIRRNAQAHKRGRYWYTNTCKACLEPFKASRKMQAICQKCRKSTLEHSAKSKGYIYHFGTSIPEHRYKAQELLGRMLHVNEVVHHMNEDSQNNDFTNLIILDRRVHGRLHHYLRLQRVIIEKSINENVENCWDNLRVPMTTAWLETANAKVVKLWEIGQSAAEPLHKLVGEGSETMHDRS